MSDSILISLLNHLWQSTLFAIAAGGLTLLLQKNSARTRYLLWLAASTKFLIPFAILTAIGSEIPLPFRVALEAQIIPSYGQIAAHMTQLGSESSTVLAPVGFAVRDGGSTLTVFVVLWALGAAFVAGRWFVRWLLIRRALLGSTEVDRPFVIAVRTSPSQLEPAVVGVLRPILLLPEDLEQRLTHEEMSAVLAHESCHVAWCDNLAAAVHMLVEALFWFYPLIWWIGTRLVNERERACDEHVLAGGHRPESYAEGILKICEHYLCARMACAAGISGTNLRQRIEDILHNRRVEKLGGIRKLLITAAACGTMAVPLAIGILTSPHVLAQPGTSNPWEIAFRDVSIRSTSTDAKSPATVSLELLEQGHATIHLSYPSLRSFIADAYGISVSQVIGRDWSQEPRYEITAEVPDTAETSDASDADVSDLHFNAALVTGLSTNDPQAPIRTMMRDLLAKYFGLAVKAQRRPLEGYVLETSSAGSKVTPNPGGPYWKKAAYFSPDGFDATDSPFGELVRYLQNVLQAPVIDRTRLMGAFDYKASWRSPPRSARPDPATVAKALEEQLGLNLEPRRLTVNVIDVVGLKSPKEIVTHR